MHMIDHLKQNFGTTTGKEGGGWMRGKEEVSERCSSNGVQWIHRAKYATKHEADRAYLKNPSWEEVSRFVTFLIDTVPAASQEGGE